MKHDINTSRPQLHIGDLMLYHGSAVRVTALDTPSDCAVVTALDDTACYRHVSPSDTALQPIPLTRDILIADGWQTGYIGMFFHPDILALGLLQYTGRSGGCAFQVCAYHGGISSITCVHQLQHLLAALGYDSDISLTQTAL